MREDRISVYEIGYLIASSVNEGQVGAEEEKIKKIITGAGGSVIAEESPYFRDLAYTISRKTLAGSYDKYDNAYFGWIKFEISSGVVESVKKAVEALPTVLRALLITTVRENTYLGKKAPLIPVKNALGDDKAVLPALGEIGGEQAPASIEEMDKSIDEMVKEV